MKPRDLVRRTLDFASPPSAPRQAWVSRWAEEHHRAEVRRLRTEFPDDIVFAPELYCERLPVTGDRYRKGPYVDEWGCRFDNPHDGVLGIVREPAIRDWDDLERFRAPEAALRVDRDAVNAFCAATDRFVLAGNLVRPFERLGFLRTTEQALVDLLLHPPGFLELLRRVHLHYCREVEAWAATSVDGIVIMDDWGAHDRLLVPPALWRTYAKPLYAEYCSIARRSGKRVFMHSDGHILDILPDLIETGVEALNSQVSIMGVDALARFRGRVTFWGEIDRHDVLALGSFDDVRRAVREVRERLHANGGVIAQCEFGPGARPENVFEVFRTWKELDEPR